MYTTNWMDHGGWIGLGCLLGKGNRLGFLFDEADRGGRIVSEASMYK